MSLLLSGAGGIPDAVPPAPAAYWNPSDKNAAITLSNADKRASWTESSATPISNLRGVTSRNSGKYYAEMKLSAAYNDLAVGVAKASQSLSAAAPGAAGGDGAACRLSIFVPGFATSIIYQFNGSGTSGPSTLLTGGERVGIAHDIDAGKIWFAIANNYNGADPAAGSGAHCTGLGAGPWYPIGSFLNLSNSGSVFTIDLETDAASFFYAPPSGFSAWG